MLAILAPVSALVPTADFSFDPLIAEAQRRARRRRTAVLAALLVVAAAGAAFAIQTGADAPLPGAASGRPHVSYTTVVLVPVAPHAAGAYVRIHGPAGAVELLARLERRYFETRDILGGLVATPETHVAPTGTSCFMTSKASTIRIPAVRKFGSASVSFEAGGSRRDGNLLCRWVGPPPPTGSS